MYHVTYLNDDIREKTIWALGNIFGDSIKCRDLVLKRRVIKHIPTQFTITARLSILINSKWTLSNFYRENPQPQFDKVFIKVGIFPKMVEHLLHPSPIFLVLILRRIVGSIIIGDYV
eukprot:Gb_14089 [translate_table: standard]